MARNFALEPVLLFPRRRNNTAATAGTFGLIAAGVAAGLLYQDVKAADTPPPASPAAPGSRRSPGPADDTSGDAPQTKPDFHPGVVHGLLNATFGTGCTHNEFEALLKWREENRPSGQ